MEAIANITTAAQPFGMLSSFPTPVATEYFSDNCAEVILADDDYYMMRSVEILLQTAGYRLEVKEEGQAVSYLRACRENQIGIDELKMMDGLEIVRYIKSNFRKGDKIMIVKARQVGEVEELLRNAYSA